MTTQAKRDSLGGLSALRAAGATGYNPQTLGAVGGHVPEKETAQGFLMACSHEKLASSS